MTTKHNQCAQATLTADPLSLAPFELLPIVSQSLGRKAMSLQVWSVNSLHYAVRNPISAGLYRVSGTGHADGTCGQDHQSGNREVLRWSLILKVVQPPTDGLTGDIEHWNYWRREALAYESNLLERITAKYDSDPPGLAAPRCWKVEQKLNGYLWLWLEDVVEEGSGPWTLERYSLAAQHLGSFQASFLRDDSLPSQAWLSRRWMRARVASFSDAMHRLSDPAVWEAPLVRQICPRSLEVRLLRLWNERGELLDALDRLPQTLCHLDVWRPNLLSRIHGKGEQTVALDWSYIGIGAVGQDIGNLVPDSVGNFDIGIDQAKAMDHAVFEGYLQGLHEGGWAGRRQQVRLGYAASAALGWGLGTPWWLVWPQDPERQAQIEQRWGQSLEELLTQRVAMTEFVLDLADEAHELIAFGVDRINRSVEKET